MKVKIKSKDVLNNGKGCPFGIVEGFASFEKAKFGETKFVIASVRMKKKHTSTDVTSH